MNNKNDQQETVNKHVLFMKTPRKDMQADGPLILEKGDGIRVYDTEGREYIDCLGGAGRSNVLGYNRPEMAQALYDQALKVPCHSARQTITPAGINVTKKLADLAPNELSVVTLATGGSDANETAFKIAKQYFACQNQPNRYKIISRRGAFHGTTLGALAATGSMSPIREMMQPPVAGYYFIPAPTCYRCPFNKTYPHCELECARALEEQILFEDPNQIAAFIAEPVMQSRGVQIPPPEYFPKIRSICDKYGVLLIDDEVITGFGRTGYWFACEQFGFVPDLLTFAKAFTSGYVPMGGVITKSLIAEVLPIFMEIRTFSMHAVGCAAAEANLSIIEKEGLLKKAKDMGQYMLDSLKTLEHHPIVGDVRGIGLWCGIEFVQDKKSKAMFAADKNPAPRIVKKARERGVLLASVDQSIEIAPPLIITKSDIDQVVKIMDVVISEVEKE